MDEQFFILALSLYRTSFLSPILKCNRQLQLVKSAMDASYGDMSNDSAGNFSFLKKLNSYDFLIWKISSLGHRSCKTSILGTRLMVLFPEAKVGKIKLKWKMIM